MSKKFPHINLVRFYKQPVEDRRASEKAGRPIFKDREMVELRFAGETKRVHHAPAHEPFMQTDRHGGHATYAEVFDDEYAAFQRGEEAGASGTPIHFLPGLTQARAAELNAKNVSTIEALAALNASAARGLGMDGEDLTRKAEAYLNSADQSATISQMEEVNASLQAQLDELRAMIAQPQAPTGFDAMSDDELRAHLEANGIEGIRKNAAREKLLEAAQSLEAA